MSSESYEKLKKAIAKEIKSMRERRGLRQVEVSELGSLDYRHYQKIEGGYVNLSIKTIHRICEILKIDLATLLARAEEQVQAQQKN